MEMNERFVRLLLDNFWRLSIAFLAFFWALIWAIFGWEKTVIILCLTLLGYLLGKWRDDNRGKGSFTSRIGRPLK
jgi:uncharacterized membrane protein